MATAPEARSWRRWSRPSVRARASTPRAVAQRQAQHQDREADLVLPGQGPASQKSPAARGGYSSEKSA